MEAANRYTFREKDIQIVIRVLGGELDESKAPKWYHRYKAEIKLDKNMLLLGGKQIVSVEKLPALVRSLLFTKGSKIPWARESGYNIVKNEYIGLSKRAFFKVIQGQQLKVTTDSVPPPVKKAGARVTRRGMLECDLFHISSGDLPAELARSMKGPMDLDKNKQGYTLTCVDKLTGLTFAHYLGASKGAKSQVRVMKVIREKMLPFFAETLKIPPSKLYTTRDAGGEFKRPGPAFRGRILKVGNHIENRNRTLQTIMHRLIRSKRGSLTSVVKQSQDIINNTVTYRGFTPLQAVLENDSALTKLYNSKRSKAGGDRLKDLKLNDRVRLVTKKKKGEAFYKSYQGTQWSKQLYTISKVGKTNPKRYFVNKKWKHRHELSTPQPENDKETQKLLDARTAYGNPKFKGPRPKKQAKKIKHPIGKRLKERKELTLGERLELAKKRNQ